MSADVAAQLVVGLMGPVYAQLDPARLGEVERHVRVSSEYGERLKTANVKDRTIARLAGAYPSHGFVIDRREARELFESVEKPIDALEELADSLKVIKSKVISSGETFIKCLTEGVENAEENDVAASPGEAIEQAARGTGRGKKPGNGQVRPSPKGGAGKGKDSARE